MSSQAGCHHCKINFQGFRGQSGLKARRFSCCYEDCTWQLGSSYVQAQHNTEVYMHSVWLNNMVNVVTSCTIVRTNTQTQTHKQKKRSMHRSIKQSTKHVSTQSLCPIMDLHKQDLNYLLQRVSEPGGAGPAWSLNFGTVQMRWSSRAKQQQVGGTKGFRLLLRAVFRDVLRR